MPGGLPGGGCLSFDLTDTLDYKSSELSVVPHSDRVKEKQKVFSTLIPAVTNACGVIYRATYARRISK